MNYQTPGVYVEEKSVLGTTLVGLPTAIPAFIGYTLKVPEGYDKDSPRPIEVKNLVEYQEIFGTAPPEPLKVALNDSGPGSVAAAPKNDELLQTMYYNLQLFYNNGGGKCYVVSLGAYSEPPGTNLQTEKEYNTAIDTLAKKSDITLLVLTDAAYYLKKEKKYGVVCQHALDQCQEIVNRFTILDTVYERDETDFRTAVGNNNLMYGAAYTPYLNTTITPEIGDKGDNIEVYNYQPTIETGEFKVSYNGSQQNAFFSVTTKAGFPLTSFEVRGNSLAITCDKGIAPSVVITAWDELANKGNFTLTAGNGATVKNQEKTGFTSKSFFTKKTGENDTLVISYQGGAFSDPQVVINVEKGGTEEPTITVEGQLLTIDCNDSTTNSALLGDYGNFTVTTTKGDDKITDSDEFDLPQAALYTDAINGLQISYLYADGDKPKVKFEVKIIGNKTQFSISGTELTIKYEDGSTPQEILTAWSNQDNWENNAYQGAFSMVLAKGELPPSVEKIDPAQDLYPVTNDKVELSEIENNEKYYQILAGISAQVRVNNFPPSGAMAGIYNKIDEERGVWRSPANISLNSVLAPSQGISPGEQENLNVDAKTGKSINAIRAFLGKGSLVWGARTLDGNSNDWRYISVRRLFSYVEASIQNSLQSYVFESNNEMTWLKVRATIETFLNNLWQDGGLAGSSASDAFYVNVGLGSTMTAQDILEGKMKISIGLAALRPAEFIILEVTQLMQK